MGISYLFIIFIFIFLISLILFKFYSTFAKKFQLIDRPSNLNVHKEPIPTSSGIVFIIIFLPTIIFYNYYFDINLPKNYILFYFGLLILFSVSFIDDLKNIHPLIRLVVQITVIFVCLSTFYLQSINLPLKLTMLLVLYFWVYLINIINFTDGSDGFLATNSIVIFIGIFLFYFLKNDFNLSLSISTIFTPILIAYLIFNKPKAKLFMGDSGSIIIGFCIGYCSIKLLLINEYALVISLLAYTIIDCTYSLIKKTLDGNYPWARMFDYQFLKPLKNEFGHDYIFKNNLVYNFFNLIIIITQIIYGIKILCVVSIILSILLILRYNNKI